MNNDQLQIGQIHSQLNAARTRILKYTIEIWHEGLKEHKLISAPDTDILENKMNIQIQKWNEKWESVIKKNKYHLHIETNQEEANRRTQEATELMNQLDTLLIQCLEADNTIDWETLKRKDRFSEKLPHKPTKKSLIEYPVKPDSESFIPTFSFFEKIIKSKREKKIENYHNKYLSEIANWENEKQSIDLKNIQINNDYEMELNNWRKEVEKYEKKQIDFEQQQSDYNAKIEKMKDSYFNLNVESIIDYVDMVLNNSEYPDFFPKNFELDYNPNTKFLIVEYECPFIDIFPRIKEVKYVTSKNEFKESYISEMQLNKIFDETLYKIALRTLYEIFMSDSANSIDAISFNGWVKASNKATGKQENNCILSILVKKDNFLDIDLHNVDPKTCFKSFKGVASSKLSSITPIQPILQINKKDKRFIDSHSMVDQIEDTTNLAAMDWEDFEHLIRELFEKEFQSNVGEVKVTQASRDGGVDAIAFDPDPIRGGKIVIQAKRYTNTVGVSSVRDLYGTVVNEGATKGILVSTADYGPDSYEFAKGKPLTLLNGANLLFLLEKHGLHAKIDIKEAKKLLADK